MSNFTYFDPACYSPRRERESAPFPPVNIYEDAAEVRILALAPGAGEAEVNVSLEAGELSISGLIRHHAQGRSHRRERFCGGFCRKVRLLAPFRPESMTWAVRNGIVDVRLPKP